jgi:hypothetical protein
MNKKKELIVIISIAFPICAIVLNLFDIISLFDAKASYPFGSEFFSAYSIYSSKWTYIAYNCLSFILSFLAIYYTVKKKWGIYFIMLFFCILSFIYPIITNQ